MCWLPQRIAAPVRCFQQWSTWSHCALRGVGSVYDHVRLLRVDERAQRKRIARAIATKLLDTHSPCSPPNIYIYIYIYIYHQVLKLQKAKEDENPWTKLTDKWEVPISVLMLVLTCSNVCQTLVHPRGRLFAPQKLKW